VRSGERAVGAAIARYQQHSGRVLEGERSPTSRPGCSGADLIYCARMSSADVDTLKRGYDALNRGDLSVVLELLDRDAPPS
jgi:hypothetical protein